MKSLNFSMIRRPKNQIEVWINQHNDLEHRLFVTIIVIGLLLIFYAIISDWGPYKIGSDNNHLYLLSSVYQGLAAILALLLMASLVSSQLAAGAYTPRVVKQRLFDSWLWFAVVIYLLAICWSLIVLSALSGFLKDYVHESVNIALVLTSIALFYIVPFTIATFKAMYPENIANRLAKDDDHDALDELMRKAINDGTLTMLRTTLICIYEKAILKMNDFNQPEEIADEFSKLLISVGRYACQHKSPDALEIIIIRLTLLTTYCNDHPRLWRGSADIFNEAITELYNYSESFFGD